MKKPDQDLTSRELSPDEQPQTIPLTEVQRLRAEQEKAALLEALKPVPAAARPEARDGLTQRSGPSAGIATRPTVRITLTDPKRMDAAKVRAELDAATAQVQEQEAKIKAAEAADLAAKTQREAELEQARMVLGSAQATEAKLKDVATSESLKDQAADLTKNAAANRAVESSSDAAKRAQFAFAADGLMAKITCFLEEVEPWAAAHLPALRALANTTWRDTDPRWTTKARVQYAERATPARELAASVANMMKSAREVLTLAESVIAGQAKPYQALLDRLANAANYSVSNLQGQLNVLNHSLSRAREVGDASIIPGHVPTVTLRESVYGGPPMNSDPDTTWRGR